MPSLIEPTDYDLFDYKNSEERPATLEEALKTVSNLRNSDKSQFHRIVPVDAAATGFKVMSVSKEEVVAELVSKAARLYARFLGHGWPTKQQPK